MINFNNNFMLQNVVGTYWINCDKENYKLSDIYFCSYDKYPVDHNITNIELKNFTKPDMNNIISDLTRDGLHEPEAALAFCNKYGLLESRVYASYIFEKLQQNETTDRTNYYCNSIGCDSMYVTDFLYRSEMIRVLIQVCYWNQNNVFSKETGLEGDPTAIKILQSIFKLLLRKYDDIFKIEKPRNLLLRNNLITALDDSNNSDDITNGIINQALTIFNEISEILDGFSFDEEYLVIYKEDTSSISLKNAEKTLSMEKEALFELLKELSICKINHDLRGCTPYIQKQINDSSEATNILMFSYHSLYQGLLLKILSYICSSDVHLRRCINPRCNCLFEVFPGRRSQKDKKFCSHKCASYIAKQKFNDRKSATHL